MSQFAPAFQYLMRWEDPALSYESVADDRGQSISGINSVAWPKSFAEILATPQHLRGNKVYAFYRDNFWTPLQLGGITLQPIASRVLDMCVNAGPGIGSLLLQSAVNALGAHLVADGVLGPDTFDAVNGMEEERMLAAYRVQRVAYYRNLVAAKPEDAKYLAEWLRRAQN